MDVARSPVTPTASTPTTSRSTVKIPVIMPIWRISPPKSRVTLFVVLSQLIDFITPQRFCAATGYLVPAALPAPQPFEKRRRVNLQENHIEQTFPLLNY